MGIADLNGNPIMNSKEKSFFVPTLNFCHQTAYISEDGFPKTNVSCVEILMTNCLSAGINLGLLGVKII